jgi:hypothetical protein
MYCRFEFYYRPSLVPLNTSIYVIIQQQHHLKSGTAYLKLEKEKLRTSLAKIVSETLVHRKKFEDSMQQG